MFDIGNINAESAVISLIPTLGLHKGVDLSARTIEIVSPSHKVG